MFGPERACPQCDKTFRQGKHNQRFCNQQCKDDFHNAEKIAAHHQWKLSQVEAAEERRDARLEVNGNGGERKPLSQILEGLKPETLIPKSEPTFKRRAW